MDGVTNFIIGHDRMNRVRAVAKQNSLTYSELVRQAIDAYLVELEHQNGKKKKEVDKK
jgi:predicted DNA-binding protein